MMAILSIINLLLAAICAAGGFVAAAFTGYELRNWTDAFERGDAKMADAIADEMKKATAMAVLAIFLSVIFARLA